jgi:hypothetical protein
VVASAKSLAAPQFQAAIVSLGLGADLGERSCDLLQRLALGVDAEEDLDQPADDHDAAADQVSDGQALDSGLRLAGAVTVIALLEPVVKQELAYYADETTWDEYPESDVPLRLLGDEVLMDATWAIAGDDSLASVLALLERRLDTAFDTPGRPASLTGRAAAEALIRAFPDHFECRAPGDEACLERLRATGRTSSNPLCDLVRDKVIAPEDALPVGLTILAALADLARTSAFSVLDAST